MDNEFEELENELKRLRPIAPSELLAAHIESRLISRRWTLFAWAGLPMAAALAGVLIWKGRPVIAESPRAISQPAETGIYKPVAAENILYDQADEGLVTLADGSAARRYRRSYVDTITWKNPATQASLRWSVPRTEERIIPVSFQ